MNSISTIRLRWLCCVLIIAYTIFPISTSAVASEFLTDPNSNCAIWHHRDATDLKMTYNGTCENGLANGLGRAQIWFPNGKIYYTREGEFLDGRLHGHGVYKLANLVRYEGSFLAGTFNGTGKLEVTGRAKYVGSFKNGKPDGTGFLLIEDDEAIKFGLDRRSLSFSDDSIGPQAKFKLEGEFSNGTPNGKTTVSLGNQIIYQGEVKAGVHHGQGTLYLSDEWRYEGRFENGQYHGSGALIRSDGLINQGEWNNGDRIK